MGIPPVLTPQYSASAARAMACVQPAGNATSAGTFDGESAEDERVAQRRVADRRAAGLAQNGTAGNAPVWYGPPLRPVFVAQVLGQVLMRDHQQASPLAGTPYRSRAQVARGRLLNRDA